MDEQTLIPGQIENGIHHAIKSNRELLTLYCEFFCKEDAISKLSAKIVTNNNDEILYMSRSVIPITKNGIIDIKRLKKNVGVFYFRREFLDKLSSYGHRKTELDGFEGLEQLRWLELGFSIKVYRITHYGFGIDVPEQVEQLEKRIQCLQQHTK